MCWHHVVRVADGLRARARRAAKAACCCWLPWLRWAQVRWRRRHFATVDARTEAVYTGPTRYCASGLGDCGRCLPAIAAAGCGGPGRSASSSRSSLRMRRRVLAMQQRVVELRVRLSREENERCARCGPVPPPAMSGTWTRCGPGLRLRSGLARAAPATWRSGSGKRPCAWRVCWTGRAS